MADEQLIGDEARVAANWLVLVDVQQWSPVLASRTCVKRGRLFPLSFRKYKETRRHGPMRVFRIEHDHSRKDYN